jgi:hypothetical protein
LILVADEGVDGSSAASTGAMTEMRTRDPTAVLLRGLFTGDGDELLEGRRRKKKKMCGQSKEKDRRGYL